MPADMDHALKAIHDHLVHGVPVPMSAGREWPAKSFAAELADDLPRGTSANHRLLWATCGLLRGEARATEYLTDRARHELTAAFGLTEAWSPSYWALHRYLWMVVAGRGPVYLAHLAARWLDRDVAMSALCSAVRGGGVRTYTPGHRDDNSLRRAEQELLGLLLNLPIAQSVADSSSYWGWVVRGARALPVGLIAEPETWRRVVHEKPDTMPNILRDVRLLAPVEYWWWDETAWAAWVGIGTHGQDPTLHGVVDDGGLVRLLRHPLPDPPEGGWSSAAGLINGTTLEAVWRRGGVTWKRTLPLLAGPPAVTWVVGGRAPAPAQLPRDQRLRLIIDHAQAALNGWWDYDHVAAIRHHATHL